MKFFVTNSLISEQQFIIYISKKIIAPISIDCLIKNRSQLKISFFFHQFHTCITVLIGGKIHFIQFYTKQINKKTKFITVILILLSARRSFTISSFDSRTAMCKGVKNEFLYWQFTFIFGCFKRRRTASI